MIDYRDERYSKEVLARMLEGRDLSDQKAKDARVAWHSDLRLDALSDVSAAEADNNPGVVRFRREVLRGKLMRPEKVWPWIERQAKRPRPAATYYPDSDLQIITPDAPLIFRPDGSFISPVEDTPLGHMSRISENLYREYGWDAPAARAFLLCGVAPKLGATYEPEYGARLEWIRLRVPVTFGAGDVGDMYAEARQEVWGKLGIDRTRSRTRRIDPQTAERAVFAARHNTGATWREALEAWNTAHEQPFRTKDGRPADWRAFRDALARAYQQVTWQKLVWVGGGASRNVSEPSTTVSPDRGTGKG
jgi:hypothetical protein